LVNPQIVDVQQNEKHDSEKDHQRLSDTWPR